MEEITIRKYQKGDKLEDVARVWSASFGNLQKKTGITEDLADFDISMAVASECNLEGGIIDSFCVRLIDQSGILAVTKEGKVVGANFITNEDKTCNSETVIRIIAN
jgi:hypothetical protein